MDGEDGVLLSYGKYAFKMTPALEYKKTDEEKQHTNQLKKDNEITYSLENEKISYDYSVLNNGVKENLIINEKPDSNT